MGEVIRGVLLVNATRTATGTGPAYQVPAVLTGQRLVATLHVTAASAGDTLNVALQSDSAEGMGSPTTQITFDQVAGIGSQQKEVDGPITDTWYRESRTIAGSATSFTYAITVGVAAGAATTEPTETLPPLGQESLVLASPLNLGEGSQAITMLVGPAGQLGSTAGSDANDPTFGGGPPPAFTFDASDYITFGDVLDATFQGAFSIMVASWPDATDVNPANNRMMMSKDVGASSSFICFLNNGKPRVSVYYGGGSAFGDDYSADATISAAKHRISISFDPAAARAARGVVYVDGAAVAMTNSPSGTDGVIANSTADLRQGLADRTAIVGLSVMGPVYIWNRVLSASEMLQNSDWLATNGW